MSLHDLYPNGIFISHTSAPSDKTWAIWVEFILREQGLKTTLDEYDFTSSPSRRMDEALKTQALLCIHSERYASGDHNFASAEWQSFFSSWKEKKVPEHHLLVLCVDTTSVRGLLTEPRRATIHGKDREQAVAEILKFLHLPPARPTKEPHFPGGGAEPSFPGAVSKPAGRMIGIWPPALDERFPRPEALAKIRAQLDKTGRAHIAGMPGVGKTQLACAYAIDAQTQYDRLIWLNAESPTGLRAQYADLATDLGLPIVTGADSEARQIAQVRAKLSQLGSWLLIFDNIEADSGFEKLMPQSLPAHSHVLTTGREPRIQGMMLAALDNDAATRFLCQPDSDDADVRALAMDLGGLPIALTIARSLRQRGQRWGEIRRQLATQKLLNKIDPIYGQSVAAMFDLALANARHDCAAADEILAALSLLAAEPVPLALLELALPSDHVVDGIDALVIAGLVQRDDRHVSLHRLSQQHFIQTLSVERLVESAHNIYGSFRKIHNEGHSLSISILDIILHGEYFLLSSRKLISDLYCWNHIHLGQFYQWAGNLISAQRHILSACQQVAEWISAHPNDIEARRTLAISYGNAGDISLALGQFNDALTSYRMGAELQEKLCIDSKDPEHQRDIFLSYLRIGDTLSEMTHTSEAMVNFRVAHNIAENLMKKDPGNITFQRDLTLALDRIADAAQVQGVIDEAIKALFTSHQIRMLLSQSAPENAQWQCDLSISYNKIGDIKQVLGQSSEAISFHYEACKIMEELTKSDANNSQWQHNLSICQEKIGNSLVNEGKFSEAKRAYLKSNHIAKKLVEFNSGNTAWKGTLAISYEKIGNVAIASGNLRDAEDAYKSSFQIWLDLVNSNTQNHKWQYSLSILHQKIGDTKMAQEHISDARISYRASQKIMVILTQFDPTNTRWQNSLSIAYNKMGNLAMAQGQLGRAMGAFSSSREIRKRLILHDPTNTEWQRNLSVSHTKVGDVAMARGNLDDALTFYQEGLSSVLALTKSNPDNNLFQHDLCILYGKIGDAHLEKKRSIEATSSYNNSLITIKKLLNNHPNNINYARALSTSHSQIAKGHLFNNDYESARTALIEGRRIMADLVARFPDWAEWHQDLAWFDRTIATLPPPQ